MSSPVIHQAENRVSTDGLVTWQRDLLWCDFTHGPIVSPVFLSFIYIITFGHTQLSALYLHDSCIQLNFAACLKATVSFKNRFKHYCFIESFHVPVPQPGSKTSPSFMSQNAPWLCLFISVFSSCPSSVEPPLFIVTDPWRIERCLAQWKVNKFVPNK